MSNNNRSTGAILAIMLVVVLVGIGAATGLSRLNNPNSYVGNDCFRFRSAIEHVNNQLTLAVWQDSRTKLETQRAELFQQAADAKCIEDVKRLPGAPPDFGKTPDTTPATTTPTDATTSDPNWIHWFTKDPGKDKLRAFGPSVVVNNDQELWTEFERHIMIDPSLNCEDGGLILNDSTDTFQCTTELMKSEEANRDYANRVMANISSMELVQAYKQSGKVHTSYMAVNQDGIPVVYKIDMPRTEDYLVAKVTTKDGRVYVFVLKCGFQWEEGTNFNPPEQKVAKTEVTKRSKPIVESDKCVNGGERNDGGECVPPANNIIETPKPKPEPTDTPKPEPTPESTPTPEPKPEPTPTPEPKKPEDDVNVNPSIPPEERVDPIQSAPPDQAQPTKPPEAPTTPPANPAPPAPDPVPRDDPAPPPPPEDDGPVNGGDPVAP